MGDAERGQVDTSAAEVYDALFVPALFGGFAAAVADAAGIGPGDDVVDVACGTGALTREARSRTRARVVGVDLNPGMLAVARRRDDTIDYVRADAQDLPFAGGEFDVATCQFGLMFLPGPARGVTELVRVGRRGAVAVWDTIGRSDGYLALQELFRDELGADAAATLDAPFAMGRPGVLEGLLAGAAATQVSIRSVAGQARFASIDQWVTTEVRGWTLGQSIGEQRLADLFAIARTRLARFATDSGCAFPVAARIATWG